MDIQPGKGQSSRTGNQEDRDREQKPGARADDKKVAASPDLPAGKDGSTEDEELNKRTADANNADELKDAS